MEDATHLDTRIVVRIRAIVGSDEQAIILLADLTQVGRIVVNIA